MFKTKSQTLYWVETNQAIWTKIGWNDFANGVTYGDD